MLWTGITTVAFTVGHPTPQSGTGGLNRPAAPDVPTTQTGHTLPGCLTSAAPGE